MRLPGFVPKNIITRSLGPHASVQVDLEGPFPLEPDDTFLLCSDGLTGQVCDEEIGVLLQCLPPPEAAQVLIDLANLRGGPDNITVIIARVKGPTLTAAGGWQVEPLSVGVDEAETSTVVTKSTTPLWIAAAALLFLAVVLGAVLADHSRLWSACCYRSRPDSSPPFSNLRQSIARCGTFPRRPVWPRSACDGRMRSQRALR